MYQVTKVMTNDGQMFNTVTDAKHYLEKNMLIVFVNQPVNQ